MRIIIHGPLAQVAAITPGQLVIQVTQVSEPYQNRKGTPRLHRVYLEGEIAPASAATTSIPTPGPAAPPPAGPAAGSPPVPSVVPLEIQGGDWDA